MTNNIQVYADIANTVQEGNGLRVQLNGIDPTQVVGEFSSDELLDCIDLDTVMQYVTRKLSEDEE